MSDVCYMNDRIEVNEHVHPWHELLQSLELITPESRPEFHKKWPEDGNNLYFQSKKTSSDTFLQTSQANSSDPSSILLFISRDEVWRIEQNVLLVDI